MNEIAVTDELRGLLKDIGTEDEWRCFDAEWSRLMDSMEGAQIPAESMFLMVAFTLGASLGGQDREGAEAIQRCDQAARLTINFFVYGLTAAGMEYDDWIARLTANDTAVANAVASPIDPPAGEPG